MLSEGGPSVVSPTLQSISRALSHGRRSCALPILAEFTISELQGLDALGDKSADRWQFFKIQINGAHTDNRDDNVSEEFWQRKQAELLKEVLLNCSIDDVSLYPTYRKPFNMIAKRAKFDAWSGQRDSNHRPSAPKTGQTVYGSLLKSSETKCLL